MSLYEALKRRPKSNGFHDRLTAGERRLRSAAAFPVRTRTKICCWRRQSVPKPLVKAVRMPGFLFQAVLSAAGNTACQYRHNTQSTALRL